MNDFIATLAPLCRLPKDESDTLLAAVWKAHRVSAQDNNSGSKSVCSIIANGSGSLGHSLCGAILSTGRKHGPIKDARAVLRYMSIDQARQSIISGRTIPGFGNSFFKDGIDPAWQDVAALIEVKNSECGKKITALRDCFVACGKNTVYPNAAILSAAICEIIGLPDGLEDAIFILPRMNVWLNTFIQTLNLGGT